MTKVQQEDIAIKLLDKDEAIPYELLLDADPSRELVDKYLVGSEIYLAYVEMRIIGVYVLYPINSKTIEIKNIAVKDDFQGRGIGTIMLLDAIQKAKHKGYKEIIIGTANSSVGQLYLYQKAGFEIAAIKRNFFIENYTEQLFDNGLQVKHMIVLTKQLMI